MVVDLRTVRLGRAASRLAGLARELRAQAIRLPLPPTIAAVVWIGAGGRRRFVVDPELDDTDLALVADNAAFYATVDAPGWYFIERDKLSEHAPRQSLGAIADEYADVLARY